MKILNIAVILLLSGVAAGTSYVQANGQTIAKVNDSGIYYYNSDHLGSTGVITNSKGEAIEEQKNLPFGELVSGSERYGFAGKELDETGLQYFGSRYYNPNSGRFLNSDPVQDRLNWYSYVSNNPLKLVDPTGNKEEYPLAGGRHLGINADMFGYKDKEVPFYIYVPYKNDKELKNVIKDVKKVGGFINDNPKRFDKFTNAHIIKLFIEVNECLKYLSGNKFSLKLMSIYRGDDIQTSFLMKEYFLKKERKIPREEIPPIFFEKEGFKMIFHPMTTAGFYFEEGLFAIDPYKINIVSVDLKGEREYRGFHSLVGITAHEILHGFLGEDHPQKEYADLSIMAKANTLSLLSGESDYLGWPHIKPENIYEFQKKFEEGIRFLMIGEGK